MSKRAIKINLLFLVIIIAVVSGFYFLRKQSPCDISSECLQCLKDINCFTEGDCINKCAKKPECWGLTRCPNLSEILSKNYEQEKDYPGLVKSSKEENDDLGSTTIEQRAMTVGQAQVYEIDGQKYKIEIVKLCQDCYDGQGDFSLKINGELNEGLHYGDVITLTDNLDLGIRKKSGEEGDVVDFHLIQNVASQKELTIWEKTINNIKNFLNKIYERFN